MHSQLVGRCPYDLRVRACELPMLPLVPPEMDEMLRWEQELAET